VQPFLPASIQLHYAPSVLRFLPFLTLSLLMCVPTHAAQQPPSAEQMLVATESAEALLAEIGLSSKIELQRAVNRLLTPCLMQGDKPTS
jgi:hypothetical protein